MPNVLRAACRTKLTLGTKRLGWVLWSVKVHLEILNPVLRIMHRNKWEAAVTHWAQSYRAGLKREPASWRVLWRDVSFRSVQDETASGWYLKQTDTHALNQLNFPMYKTWFFGGGQLWGDKVQTLTQLVDTFLKWGRGGTLCQTLE